TFTYASNTCTPTTNKHHLIATAGYSSLPGAPAADYVLPAHFLFPEGGTLAYGPGIQTITYGAMPTDGVTSVVATSYTTTGPYTSTTATNSPTDCAGNTGSINAAPPACPGDFNNDRMRNTSDLGIMLGVFGTTVAPGAPGDMNGDGVVNTADLGAFLGFF